MTLCSVTHGDLPARGIMRAQARKEKQSASKKRSLEDGNPPGKEPWY